MNPLDLIPGIWGYVAGLVTLLGAVWGIYRHGKKVADDKHELENVNEWVETRKRIDESANNPDDVPHREWLRQRAQRKP